MTNNLGSSDTRVPISIKFLATVLICIGVLLTAVSLSMSLYGPSNKMGYEAMQRSPVAARLGSLAAAALIGLAFWLPGYYLFKKSKRALVFCTVMIVLGLVLTCYKLLFPLAIKLTQDWSIAFFLRFLLVGFISLCIPGLTCYVWIKHKDIFFIKHRSHMP